MRNESAISKIIQLSSAIAQIIQPLNAIAQTIERSTMKRDRTLFVALRSAIALLNCGSSRVALCVNRASA
ncbi:hypothetical protein [Myxacorys almedinensis]|uniref:Uncharacterized protein n=1 Tax=Myxacorys almedinensis A TaxID=2690445 RepID=A0A8J8CKV9_9CYAN|nr:hypothetical protein [Myxacorys almedinensis]NDJ17060.1 hypothetical protein [Myxacorys almedinensis A]